MCLLVQNQHYTMALIDCVYDAGWVIECLGEMNSNLHREVEELKNRPDPIVVVAAEQWDIDLETEVERLKSELGES